MYIMGRLALATKSANPMTQGTSYLSPPHILLTWE